MSATLDRATATFTVSLDVSQATSLTCVDVYLVTLLHGVDVQYFALSGHKTFTMSKLTDQDMDWAEWEGMNFLLFEAGVLQTMEDALHLAEAVTDALMPPSKGDVFLPDYEEARNRAFLAKYMDHAPEERVGAPQLTLDPSDLRTGDVLMVMRLDVDDTFIMSGTGSHVGHVAMTFWRNETDPETGASTPQLYVLEAGEGPTFKVETQKSKWEDWVAFRLKAKFNCIALRLNDHLNAKFDQQAAWAYFEKNEGGPYGFMTMLFLSVDTPLTSFPTYLGPHVIQSSFTLMEKFKPSVAATFFAPGFNKRMGTTNLTATQVLYLARKAKNLTIGEIMAIPEQDSWRYPPDLTRPSFSCSPFAAAMLRAGGVFGDVEFEVMEQTPRDLYTMNLWAGTSYQRPEACVKADPTLPYCQVFGKWRIDLQSNWNTITPYPHMNERCPAVPPEYPRPSGC